ncbi:erythrose 4-phosphate dehydrogenase [Desulfocicer vacuolatum DSM 3385]|uniref:Erythrose 4-phosphate dehydrogenase n=1 Tax=Desulfocicer vacuolatum DSM 3385 TaxID=1121400 RepID=A0A1W2A2R5_9BACT|nr:glyceraldehyde 3-phosphate dehydrogenase NAD-binding domain-containing protein [Desulfocicer vacuolatum]SMC54977.1 erythrose 4-phosphate dehydrogenase [Desulfocicer vacuolatum DSM 3385]
MAYKIAINGYGRIGRSVLRALYESHHYRNLEVVGINEPAEAKTIAHLTKYDTTHGRFSGDVELCGKDFFVNNNYIKLTHERQMDRLPWADLGVDVVMECSGAYSERNIAEQHLKSGAKRVIFSHPAEDDVDATIVFGINEETLRPEHTVISNASCTTNCSIPILRVLHDALGIESGIITTIHSTMNDQPVIDAYHHHDLRRTRCAGQSIIPVDTELARGIDRILPELCGRFQAVSMRVPTINVSALDITMVLGQKTSVKEVNHILKLATKGRLEGILGYTEEPLASCDFNHDARSSVVDGNQTRVSGNNLVKILAWFDNEWAFANRMLDTTAAWMKKVHGI